MTIQSICITGGQFISYLLGMAFKMDGGWRIMFAIGIIPAIIQAAAM